MSNQGDNSKMASWLKVIVLGVGAAGALYGAVKFLMGQEEQAPHENGGGHCSTNNSSRRRSREEREQQRPRRECLVCSESLYSEEFAIFLPCMHSVACTDCAARMRKCLQCRRPVAERVNEEGKTIAYKPTKSNDDLLCSICYENKKRIIFNCGHTFCRACSDKLRECPICRETITTKKPFY